MAIRRGKGAPLILGAIASPLVFLLLIIGCFMEALAAMLILIPILAPAAGGAGGDHAVAAADLGVGGGDEGMTGSGGYWTRMSPFGTREMLNMGRRRKATAADDIVDAVALLPWWAGVLLAVVFYVLLHHFASQPVNAIARPEQMGDVVGQTMIRTLATFGQYVLPFLCLVGAAGSAWRRRERRQLAQTIAASPATSVLDGTSWQQFERLVGEAFRQQGYQVFETGGGGADGGVDLVLTRSGEKHLVQCKQWRAFKVGVDVVRELYGVMAAKGAAGGFVVTSGRFTDEALAFAQGRNVRLFDGPKLHALLQQARQAPASGMPTTNVPVVAHAAPVPVCPVCSRPMTRRVARKGSNAGRDFWGCTEYPTCKGTRPIADVASR